MRVSTMGMNSQVMTQALKVQSEYSEALNQQSSGTKSSSLSGLDGQAGVALSLQSDIARSENLVTQAKAASSELEVAYSTLSSVTDLAESLRVSISSALDGSVTDPDSIKSEAASALESLTSLLNTKYADKYIFSGTESNTAPVDLSDADYDPLSGVADTDYYQGSSCERCLMIDSDTAIEYGITADDAAIEEVMRALSMLANMDTSTDVSDTLSETYDMLGDAATNVGLLQEEISNQVTTLENLVTAQTEFQDYAEAAYDSLTKVDVATATTEVSQIEAQLQASFAALGTVTSLSVLDYL